jgi:hypothetical protein
VSFAGYCLLEMEDEEEQMGWEVEKVGSGGSTRQGPLWRELAGHKGHFVLPLASVSTKIDGMVHR